jgi:hypothetical protein
MDSRASVGLFVGLSKLLIYQIHDFGHIIVNNWSGRRDSNPQHQSGRVARAHFLTSKCVVVLQGILLLFRQSERVIEILLALPCLLQFFSLESLEVGQVAQRSEAERL